MDVTYRAYAGPPCSVYASCTGGGRWVMKADHSAGGLSSAIWCKDDECLVRLQLREGTLAELVPVLLLQTRVAERQDAGLLAIEMRDERRREGLDGVGELCAGGWVGARPPSGDLLGDGREASGELAVLGVHRFDERGLGGHR